MWFGILTPGAHPSRETPTPEATVFCWTQQDRRKMDGPFAMVHGGLRVQRRMLHDEGLVCRPPRCFVCRRACPVPGADELRDLARRERTPVPLLGDEGLPGVPGSVLAWVHLDDLAGPAETPLDEPAVIVVPGDRFVITTPLDHVPSALALLAQAADGLPRPACADCGKLLPGSARQRAADERARALRGTTRRGGHARRAA